MTDSNKIEVEQAKLATEVKATKELIDTKLDHMHDSLHEKLDTINGALVIHIEDDQKNFESVHGDIKDHENKIIRIMTIGIPLMIVLGWIINALINKHF